MCNDPAFHKNSIIVFILIFIAFSSLFSCSGKEGISRLSFPSTPAVSTSDRFALVINPYVAVRDQPGDQGITLEHCRRGDILPVTGNNILLSKDLKKTTLWIKTEKGWLPSLSVQLFSSEARARNAAKKIE